MRRVDSIGFIRGGGIVSIEWHAVHGDFRESEAV